MEGKRKEKRKKEIIEDDESKKEKGREADCDRMTRLVEFFDGQSDLDTSRTNVTLAILMWASSRDWTGLDWTKLRVGGEAGHQTNPCGKEEKDDG